jgi:hypothetical protein
MSRLISRIAPPLVVASLGALLLGGFGAATTASEPHLPAGLSVADLSAWHGQGDLAFVSQGRLLVLDGSSEVVRVVSGSITTDYSPQFSPDGRWLLYFPSDGGVWLARGNGTDTREISTGGVAEWLPDSRLLLGSWIYRIRLTGALLRQMPAPSDLVGTVSNSNQYVFESNTLKVDYPQSSTGIERVETSSSLDGARTLWFEEHDSFTQKTGLHTDFLDVVAALPRDVGLVVSDDVDDSDEADGRPLDVIRRPRGDLTPLATTLAQSAGGNVTLSSTGELAIGAGGDRYAWSEKAVEICSPSATNCRTVRELAETSTLDPAWSPNGSQLALVEAHNEPEASIGQAVVSSWYQTHRLAVMNASGGSPRLIPNTFGAATPMWSASGNMLLYVADDGLWTVAANGNHAPTEIVAPLFAPGAWPSYYGEVDWIDQFSWNEGVAR